MLFPQPRFRNASNPSLIICYFFRAKIDTLPLCWATHQLGGIVSPANAAYSPEELKHQLLDSQAKALFTCLPLLSTALEAASLAGFPKDRIYLIDLPAQLTGGAKAPAELKTLAQFFEAGKSLPKLEKLNWSAGEGARRTAFLCYSSGTSGLPVSRWSWIGHAQKKRKKTVANGSLTPERCDDFSSQRHRQRSANHGFREELPRISHSSRIKDPAYRGCSGSASSEPHLFSRRHLPCRPL